MNGKNTKEIGRTGEDIAAKFLIMKGFNIIDRNYRQAFGEVDIVAEKGGIVRFVEVKAISRENLGDISREKEGYRPEEQVHPAKLRKIAMTAEAYMNSKRDGREYQIDVVGVFMDTKRRKAKCRLFEGVS